MNNSSFLQQLPLKYSSIFDQRDPVRMSIRVGGYEVVDQVFERLTTMVATESLATLRVTTVKEEFGLLRSYFRLNDGSHGLLEMVQGAVNVASETTRYRCEIFSARGVLHQGPCWRVHCEHCLEIRWDRNRHENSHFE